MKNHLSSKSQGQVGVNLAKKHTSLKHQKLLHHTLMALCHPPCHCRPIAQRDCFAIQLPIVPPALPITARAVLRVSYSQCQPLRVCVFVILTSSRGGLPSDAVPTARQIHPPPNTCNIIPPFQTPHQPLPGKMLADGCPLGNVDRTATANFTGTIPWLPSGIPPGTSLCDT
jgi:hypothetical protein